MSYSRFCIQFSLLLGLLTTVACTPAKPIETSTSWLATAPTHQTAAPESNLGYNPGPMTLLELGRTLSHNRVDIYDPLATSFMVVRPARFDSLKAGSIPYNRGILIPEKSVRVFSLIARDTGAGYVPPADDPMPLVIE